MCTPQRVLLWPLELRCYFQLSQQQQAYLSNSLSSEQQLHDRTSQNLNLPYEQQRQEAAATQQKQCLRNSSIAQFGEMAFKT